MISFKDQVILIIYFLIFGFFLAVMYDILHFALENLFKKESKHKVRDIISKYIIEILFWTTLTYIASRYMIKITKGSLTIYTFFFFLLGILNHFYFFHKRFIIDLSHASKNLYRIYKRIKNLIIIVVFPKEVITVARKLVRKLNFISWIWKRIKGKRNNKETLEEEYIKIMN